MFNQQRFHKIKFPSKWYEPSSHRLHFLEIRRIETETQNGNVYLSSEGLDCLFSPRCSNGFFSLLLVQRSIVLLLRAGYARQHLWYRKQQSTEFFNANDFRRTEFEKLSNCAESQDLVSYELNQDQKVTKKKKIKIERLKEYGRIKQWNKKERNKKQKSKANGME